MQLVSSRAGFQVYLLMTKPVHPSVLEDVCPATSVNRNRIASSLLPDVHPLGSGQPAALDILQVGTAAGVPAA